MKCECGFKAENNFCSKCGAALKSDIFELIKKGQWVLENALKEYSYNLDAKNNNGDTALIVATVDGFESCISILLKHGADPNVKNENSETALDFAIAKNSLRIATMLLRHGATVNAKIISSLLKDVTVIKEKAKSVETLLSVLSTMQ